MGRWMAPPGPLRDAGLGAAFLAQAAGKRMLAVDIRKPEGAEVLPSWRNPPKLPGEARRYRQLILTVRSPFTEGQDVGVLGAETWRLADLGAKHALLPARPPPATTTLTRPASSSPAKPAIGMIKALGRPFWHQSSAAATPGKGASIYS
jgi:hypothetical protein